MSFSIDALQAFILAAERGSFSAAARGLGKSQSTISESIANLEIDAGVTLFLREGRQLQLTAQGASLLQQARAVLASHDQLVQSAQRLAAACEPRLTLVLSDTFHTGDLQQVLSAFASEFPDTELECLIGEQEDVLAMLQSGRAQLGLMSAAASYPADVAVQALSLYSELSLYVAAKHPLASLAVLREPDLQQWRQLRLATVNAGSTPALQGAGSFWLAPSYLLLLEMAKYGFGWAELPHWLVAVYGEGLVRLSLPAWPRRQGIVAVSSRRHPPGKVASWLLAALADLPAAPCNPR